VSHFYLIAGSIHLPRSPKMFNSKGFAGAPTMLDHLVLHQGILLADQKGVLAPRFYSRVFVEKEGSYFLSIQKLPGRCLKRNVLPILVTTYYCSSFEETHEICSFGLIPPLRFANSGLLDLHSDRCMLS
jgi:hypothetical protein